MAGQASRLRAPAVHPVPADGMAGVEADAWDALVAPGQGAIRHAYVSAWELAELRGLSFRPLAAYRHGRDDLLAAAPAYFYDLDLTAAQPPFLAMPLLALRRTLPHLLYERTFEIGSATPLVTPLLVAGGVDEHDAVLALGQAALDEARRGGAPMLIVQNVASATGPAAEAFRELGFSCIEIPATAVLDLPFRSFDDYLSAMRAQYRRRARQALERAGELRCERLRDFAALAAELARLCKLVFDRAHEVKREVLSEPYFRAVARLDESSVLLLRRRDGAIASFALLLDDRPVLHFLYTGFEERAGRDEGAYFRLLYEIVRTAIEGGFERANLGITTLEPKLDLGARPVRLWAWLHHRRPPLQRLFARLAAGPFSPRAVAARRVFRD